MYMIVYRNGDACLPTGRSDAHERRRWPRLTGESQSHELEAAARALCTMRYSNEEKLSRALSLSLTLPRFTVTHSHKHLPRPLTFIITFSVSVCHALLASVLKAHPFLSLPRILIGWSSLALHCR